MDDLSSKSLIDDIKNVHSKIQEKVSGYSCKCSSGKSGIIKKNKDINKQHGTVDTVITPSMRKIDKVSINNVKFNTCQTNKNEKGHCISDIYTYDDFGLPVSQNTDPASDTNLLYSVNGKYIPDIDPNTPPCGSSPHGCCADNRTSANDSHGSGCNGFDYKSGLTGSPVSKLNNNALGGTKRMFIDESSGYSYMDYINSNLPTSSTVEPFSSGNSTGRRNNICTITKYAMLICIILIVILIICFYSRRSRVSRIK